MDDLRHALQTFLAYRSEDEQRAAGQLRQAQFFLTEDGHRFAPANRCLSYLDGIPFSAPAVSGRDETTRDRRLAKAGWIRIQQDHSLFGPLFDALDADCRGLTGARGVGSHFGDNPRTGKQIWKIGPALPELHEAFTKLDQDGTPDGFGPARIWFVAHPETGKPYPAKAIWGIATGQRGVDFTAHQARNALRRHGFLCAQLGPDDLPPETEPLTLLEGAERQFTASRRERNPVARKLCIEHHTRNGRLACAVCDIDFGETYGSLGTGFIHIHHLTQLADTDEEREIVPHRDLVPVCPNCHSMIHRGGENRPLEDVRAALNAAKQGWT